MSGSSLAASQAYGSVTLSPWKVRTDGTCLAAGGASGWRVVGSALMSPSLLSGSVALVSQAWPWGAPCLATVSRLDRAGC